jgi:hypothetical protein
MTQDEIIEMAMQAGGTVMAVYSPDLMRFAKLVAAKEREACAKVCEAGVDYEHPTVKGHIMENFGHSRLLAKAIRARGQA